MKVEITIAKENYFYNANLLQKAICDSDGNPIGEKVKKWLNREYDFVSKLHSDKGVKRSGYNAIDVNQKLRETMGVIAGIHGEACIENGVFLHRAKEGFDFCLFDEEYYLKKLRNKLIGDPGMYNGYEKLMALSQQVITKEKVGITKLQWKKRLDDMGGSPGENIECKKERYTVVGEIQFGNWAIAKHDFLRILNSSYDGEIDFYIYIAATGKLESKLSSGIVTFDRACNLFDENKNLLHTPIWVIGIDER